MISLDECVHFLDDLLVTSDIPDYEGALNGLQLSNSGTVSRVAAAVDFSRATVHQALELGADLLLVHHGMFWNDPQPLTGSRYERLRLAIEGNLAVYASHLPLDVHPTLGNNVQLAQQLSLTPEARFGRYKTIEVGVMGTTDLPTTDVVARLQRIAEPLGGHVAATTFATDRRTRRWAVVTGAGASTATLNEAIERGVDTMIVGEGPHHTAVEARDRGIVLLYAGHYATETLGVQALAGELERAFSLPWSFVHQPTGL